MNRLASMLFLAATLAASASLAQPASAPGAGPAAGPRMGMGMGMGMGPGGRGMPMRAGSGVTPGWSMMTPQERDDHRQRMLGAKTYDECKTAQAEHRALMEARAKERHATLGPGPRRDPCAGLPR